MEKIFILMTLKCWSNTLVATIDEREKSAKLLWSWHRAANRFERVECTWIIFIAGGGLLRQLWRHQKQRKTFTLHKRPKNIEGVFDKNSNKILNMDCGVCRYLKNRELKSWLTIQNKIIYVVEYDFLYFSFSCGMRNGAIIAPIIQRVRLFAP